MATLSLSASGNTVYWTISGLSNPFTATYYQSAGIANTAVTSGSSSITGCVSEVSSGAGGYSVSGSFTCYTGTYTFYAFAHTANGLYYPAGSAVVSVSGNTFAWDVPKNAGTNTVTATEWNRLIDFIVSKRGSFTATRAIGGVNMTLSAAMYNQMIDGMGASSNYHVTKWQAITAAKLNLLVTLANSL